MPWSTQPCRPFYTYTQVKPTYVNTNTCANTVSTKYSPVNMTYPLLVQTTYRAMIIVNTKINVLSSTGPNDLSRYMVHTTLWVLWSKRPPTTCYLNRNWRARSSKGGTPAVNILLDNDPDINMPLYVESSRQSVTNEFQQPCLLMSKGHHGAEGQ